MRRTAFAGPLVAVALIVYRAPAPIAVARASATAPATVDLPPCSLPDDVDQPLPPQPLQQIKPFDWFSWRTFAALVCDGSLEHPGQPVSAMGRSGDGVRVFETLERSSKVYGSKEPPCREAKPGDLVLTSTSKFVDDDLRQAGKGGEFGYALPAQNRTYVHYHTQFNDTSAAYIGSYLAGKQPAVHFPVGSMNVKSAWVELTGSLEARRTEFYVRLAWVRIASEECQQKLVGLVGFHVVRKTKTNSQWIWSTFEHVRNAPDAGACQLIQPPYTFHNGQCDPPMPPTWPANLPFAKPEDMVVFNVKRAFHPIADPTAEMNRDYQQSFEKADLIWRNYELVMTQWQVPGTNRTFPGLGSASAFANTTMETFFQKDVTTSCIGCHSAASDSVWSLQVQSNDQEAMKRLRFNLSKAGMQ
jgi:hypothetical protein